MKKIIDENQIQYEVSARNPRNTLIVNKVFFLSIDSILRVITSNNEIYKIPSDTEISDNEFFKLINMNKEILQRALQLDADLNLRSKEAFSLQQIMKLIDAFRLNKIGSIDNIKKIIEYFSKQTFYNIKQWERALCDNLDEFHKFLEEKFGSNNDNKNFNFYKILGFVFYNEYIKVTSEDFRLLILNKILSNQELMKYSSQIIKIIVENVVDSNPETMAENLALVKGEKSPIFKKLNNFKDKYLDEIIMNILERKVRAYFEFIPKLYLEAKTKLYPKYYKDNKSNNNKENKTGIIFDNSIIIFKDIIDFLDNFSTTLEEENENENIHICKLYSIVFVKMYLNKLVYFIIERHNELGSIKDIINVIQSIKNKPFGNVIKIYVFKLFYYYMNNNFELFKNYNYKNNGIEFYNDFPSLYREKDEIMLTYFFLPLDDDDLDKYMEIYTSFEEIRNIKFNKTTKEMSDLINKNGINIFLAVSLNKIISNLALKNYVADKDEYQNFSSFIKSLFSTKYQLSPELSKLLFLFYDEKIYMEKLRSKLAKEDEVINQQLFEMLLYGYRYCVSTLVDNNENENLLFTSFFKNDKFDLINKSYIPGIDGLYDLHLITEEDIKEHFNKYGEDCGCYVCSCGYYYYILPCGFPTKFKTFNCPVCNLKLGWGPKKVPDKGPANHGMVLREIGRASCRERV